MYHDYDQVHGAETESQLYVNNVQGTKEKQSIKIYHIYNDNNSDYKLEGKLIIKLNHQINHKIKDHYFRLQLFNC